ncbi:hypothetical protein [Spiroplasma endosymbiont of Labia minor]|uniref:hypothetical protein n=1 Tax=Spiroplasma endosymbiont of Labia minor TaxID=3066305 RepID=UPI0030D531D2
MELKTFLNKHSEIKTFNLSNNEIDQKIYEKIDKLKNIKAVIKLYENTNIKLPFILGIDDENLICFIVKKDSNVLEMKISQLKIKAVQINNIMSFKFQSILILNFNDESNIMGAAKKAYHLKNFCAILFGVNVKELKAVTTINPSILEKNKLNVFGLAEKIKAKKILTLGSIFLAICLIIALLVWIFVIIF